MAIKKKKKKKRKPISHGYAAALEGHCKTSLKARFAFSVSPVAHLFPDSDTAPRSKNWISDKEFWPFDLDDLDDFVDPPSVDPFFLRELFGMAGWSWLEDSGPSFDFCCRREWRELPEESRAGDPIEPSFERRRRECFELSDPRLVGEFTGEARLVE